MLDTKKLRQFIIKAHQNGFTSQDENQFIKEKNGSTTILFEEGDYKMEDNFFGGEPYGGREVVYFKGKAVWMMLYYGKVEEGTSQEKVYKFLKEALSRQTENKPYRGPDVYEQGGYCYETHVFGKLESFSGDEQIFLNDEQIYSADYMGGLVDM
jgi:hypothetical protein